MRTLLGLATTTWLLLAACSRSPTPSAVTSAQAASAASPSAPSSPAPPPPAGPRGTVRGTVRIAGDPAPVLDATVREIPDECAGAQQMYGRLFRATASGELGDVLVAVTDYEGVVPPAADHVSVTAKNCTWDRRTIGMTLGQRLDIYAKDARGYVPNLLGSSSPINVIPVPGGAPAQLKPGRAGRYTLQNLTHMFMSADVIVVNYSTLDVTEADGAFEIPNVPAGPVRVSALLPVAMLVEEQKVVVEAGKVTTVDFTLTFDRERFEADRQPPPAPSAAGSGAPAAPQPTAPGR